MKVMPRPTIGVMGPATATVGPSDLTHFESLATRLGAAIVKHNCVLITGATTGVPDLVSRAAKAAGGLTIGISPAATRAEHVQHYKLPIEAADVIVYTGFGLKGRNVINIRSSDIVIVFGGSIGTLNEFTIAHDEDKVIGALTGTGGVADNIEEIVRFCNKPSSSRLFFDDDPESLVKTCVDYWESSFQHNPAGADV
jgi:uncharacterized protein (TIGR00725 family)